MIRILWPKQVLRNIKYGGVAMQKLSIIEGIGDTYEKKLKVAGITRVEELLEACATKKGRTELAGKTGIAEKLILKWTNHADLIRVKGIGGEYAELLEAAGVDSVAELAKRKPDNLIEKVTEANKTKKVVRKIPTLKQIEDWVKQASELPRAIHY
jgi:predicted flap endonuclease-1-like 5' DNA nuclease